MEYLFQKGLDWIDIQMMTPHMAALGAKSIPRSEFLRKLSLAQKRKIVLFPASPAPQVTPAHSLASKVEERR
jgi:Leu/Phe-tRNA-protein transferase